MNVPFGKSLTQIAVLPPGSDRDLVDPFAEKKSSWPKIIIFAVVLVIIYAILNNLGFIHEWTNGRMGIDKRKAPVEQKAGEPVPAAPAAAR